MHSKTESGLLCYKQVNNKVKVLLCKAGGPYFKDKKRCWCYPKDLQLKKEKGKTTGVTAERAFKEKTNISLHYYNSHMLWIYRVNPQKISVAFGVKVDEKVYDLDISTFESKTREMEYPKGSGNIVKYKEMEEVAWVDIDKAKEIIFYNEVEVLERLERMLAKDAALRAAVKKERHDDMVKITWLLRKRLDSMTLKALNDKIADMTNKVCKYSDMWKYKEVEDD